MRDRSLRALGWVRELVCRSGVEVEISVHMRKEGAIP
jgi:hypothetical protein